MELHFDELPSGELETILHQRCSLPPSYCTKLVRVMQDLQVTLQSWILQHCPSTLCMSGLSRTENVLSLLQSLRRGSSVFAGKHGFITLRDLFRWADRYRLEEQTEASQDWLQHLADDGEACHKITNRQLHSTEVLTKAVVFFNQGTCCWQDV